MLSSLIRPSKALATIDGCMLRCGDLAPYRYGQDLVILVDAVQAAGPPGTLSYDCEEDCVSRTARLRGTGHHPGLWEWWLPLPVAASVTAS